MVQFIGTPERRSSFAEQFGAGLGSGLGRSAEFAQKMQLEKMKSKSFAEDVKRMEKINSMQNALSTIDKMRSIGAKGNLGRGSQLMGFFGGETAKDRGEYEQLGKSLIQLSTTIPIRNRQEFETLAGKLYDPSIPDMEREGILNALQAVIEGSIGGDMNAEPAESSSKKQTFNSSNPEHKAKAQQLFKKFGDKEKVRKALQREFEGL